MNTELKVLVVAGLLGASGAFAQGTTGGSKAASSAPKTASKQYVMDAKMHDQMMNDLKRMDTEISSLKQQLVEERKKSIDPAHHQEMMAEQKASDQKIDSLQKTTQNLRQQVEQTPQYLPQQNKDRP